MSRADRETIFKKQPIVYSDIVQNLALHPLSSDLARVTNEESVKQSIRNLITINYGEKLFNPTIGSNVYKSLFEPLDGFVIADITESIKNTIISHEPRVNLIDVRVSPIENDENSLSVTIVFNVINIGETASLNLILRRVR